MCGDTYQLGLESSKFDVIDNLADFDKKSGLLVLFREWNHHHMSMDEAMRGIENVILPFITESVILYETWIEPMSDDDTNEWIPDKKGFDPDMLDILPYQCMDGINEKGLYASIQRVDIKEGDQPSRFPAGSSMLLRYILDDCANVDEAVRKTKTGILVPEDWQDCHFMVSDESGRSVVIESRNSEIQVIPSDICTNFYLGSDDMEDSYRNGKLREEAVKMTDEDSATNRDYDYGYGHGYHRFAAILSQLECYRDTEKKDYYTRMPESAALVILRSVVQNSYTSAAGTSMTQYSAIYNNEKKTVEVWPFQNYSKSFTFDVEGNQISSNQ